MNKKYATFYAELLIFLMALFFVFTMTIPAIYNKNNSENNNVTDVPPPENITYTEPVNNIEQDSTTSIDLTPVEQHVPTPEPNIPQPEEVQPQPIEKPENNYPQAPKTNNSNFRLPIFFYLPKFR